MSFKTQAEMKTFWNGLECKATKVKIIVGKSPRDTWWCASMAGQEHDAIRIDFQNEEPFYLNDDLDSWIKITEGLGSPSYGHKSLPCEREA